MRLETKTCKCCGAKGQRHVKSCSCSGFFCIDSGKCIFHCPKLQAELSQRDPEHNCMPEGFAPRTFDYTYGSDQGEDGKAPAVDG